MILNLAEISDHGRWVPSWYGAAVPGGARRQGALSVCSSPLMICKKAFWGSARVLRMLSISLGFQKSTWKSTLLCQLCFLWASVGGRVRCAGRRDRHWASFPLTSASTAPSGSSPLTLPYAPCHALFIHKVTFCSQLLHLGVVEDALGSYPSLHGVTCSAELKHCCPPSCMHGAVWAGPWSYTLFCVSASIATWFSCFFASTSHHKY